MIFSKKDINKLISSSSKKQEFKQTLNATSLITLGVGSIIGAGLFSLTGIVAAENAGPAITFSFMIAALGCLFAGLCYAEFASIIPVSGSAYTYSYVTMGEIVAWIIGWCLILEYALGAATVAVSLTQYLNSFFINNGIPFLPDELLHSPMETFKTAMGEEKKGVINLPAVISVILLSLLVIKGSKESTMLNNVLVVIKIFVVFAFIIVGWGFINQDNLTPYTPINIGEEQLKSGQIGFFDFVKGGEFGHYGISGILRGAAVVFFAFIGFDAVSTAAQETKNPRKAIPIGILGSLIICTIIYIVFSYVLTGIVNYKDFIGDASPIATAIGKMEGYSWFQNAVTIAIITGYISVIIVMLMAQSRICYTMSKDGLLPKIFGDLHPKFKTPWKSSIVIMIAVALFSGFFPIADLSHMVAIGTLFAFAIVCLGVLVLRKTRPDLERKFKTPLSPLIPILGILVCFSMMLYLPAASWKRFIIWIILGLFVYFIYGYRKSKLINKSDKE